MRIYLLRHGIAEARGGDKADAERRLTAEGREKLRQVLAQARAAGAAPDSILSSPLVRALETARLAADILGYRGEIERSDALLPDASPPALWQEIRANKNRQAVLAAGHEPHLSAALAYLLGTPSLQVDFKKGALALLDCDRFGPQPQCVLKWLITPSMTK